FNPLRLFLQAGFAFFMVGLIKLVIDITYVNLSATTVFGFLTALLLWSLGLIADMISRLHLRP
ncbi:MAG: glycosyltransferase family 2 protein, partial [Alphaproteobacteria bacterium]